MTTALTPSQIATVRNVNERPGLSVHTIGADYAAALQAAGMVTIRKDRCYPTAAAAAYPGRDRRAVKQADFMARGDVLGAYYAR